MKPKVIIVDNNIDVCRIYEDTLNAAGYDVTAISREEEAISRIASEKPQVVLLDILMPKISGLHILDMICKDKTCRGIDIIILTELSDSNIKKKALEHGAKGYLIKSETSMKELLKKIDKVLAR
jgi:DNA-binding response OmpR family regulator